MRTRFILLPIAILLGLMSLRAQQVTDADYRIVAHIKTDGTIQDGSYKTLGYIKADGTVQDATYKTVGYLRSDGTVQDQSYRSIGHAGNIPRRWAALYFFFRQ